LLLPLVSRCNHHRHYLFVHHCYLLSAITITISSCLQLVTMCSIYQPPPPPPHLHLVPCCLLSSVTVTVPHLLFIAIASPLTPTQTQPHHCNCFLCPSLLLLSSHHHLLFVSVSDVSPCLHHSLSRPPLLPLVWSLEESVSAKKYKSVRNNQPKESPAPPRPTPPHPTPYLLGLCSLHLHRTYA
jgi:hypothetical protein